MQSVISNALCVFSKLAKDCLTNLPSHQLKRLKPQGRQALSSAVRQQQSEMQAKCNNKATLDQVLLPANLEKTLGHKSQTCPPRPLAQRGRLGATPSTLFTQPAVLTNNYQTPSKSSAW